jgi:asparagine synthase (glutamine-hydrolysing)
LNELIAGRPLPDAIAHLELEVYMGQILLRDADVMGMAHSLEIRVPFLDTEFADAALAQPAATRVPNGIAKWRLTRALREWLPEDNWRRAKRGFTLPFDAWLRGALRQRVGDQIAVLPDACPLFERQPLEKLWNRFQARPGDVNWSRPWSLFVLGDYLKRHKLVA